MAASLDLTEIWPLLPLFTSSGVKQNHTLVVVPEIRQLDNSKDTLSFKRRSMERTKPLSSKFQELTENDGKPGKPKSSQLLPHFKISLT